MHCCIDHFKIFETVREYKNGALSITDARDYLSKLNTTGYETFDTQTGAVLREIL